MKMRIFILSALKNVVERYAHTVKNEDLLCAKLRNPPEINIGYF